MFGNEPSPTLALQLLKRATERARETGGQPTKAVRRLWKIVRQDGRVVAALGEMADSPEALAEWLALTGGDHELERMLGDSNEIAADDAPLVQHVVGGSLRKRGETMKPRKM